MFFAVDEPVHETPNPILPLWQELLVGSIAFAILFLVLSRAVFPRMEKMFAARVEAIEGGLKRAEQRQAEADELFGRYQRQLAELRSEGARIREEARVDAEGIRAEIQARAQEESERIIAAGQAQLATQRQAIVLELRAYVGSLAVDLASRIVGESLLDDARQRGTVERFLAELETSAAPGGAGPGATGGRA